MPSRTETPVGNTMLHIISPSNQNASSTITELRNLTVAEDTMEAQRPECSKTGLEDVDHMSGTVYGINQGVALGLFQVRI